MLIILAVLDGDVLQAEFLGVRVSLRSQFRVYGATVEKILTQWSAI